MSSPGGGGGGESTPCWVNRDGGKKMWLVPEDKVGMVFVLYFSILWRAGGKRLRVFLDPYYDSPHPYAGREISACFSPCARLGARQT